ncbi:MAG TPA: D-2-hydroxyacid dehydrogenase family protein [Gammaproteobacteria bacterium]|jgi:phosphoglycerate dehydrogenase-like enzyme
MRVAILDDIHAAWAKTDGVRRLREIADLEIFTRPVTDPASLREFDALIANRERTRFDRELLSALGNVKLIVQTGNHAAHIDFAAAEELGITIGQASGGYSIGAAELAIGLTITVMRRIAELDAALRRGEWTVPTTPVLNGKTFGVVGLGRVGSHAARIAAACGMRILAWSPRLDAAAAEAKGAVLRPLDELLAESDVVSIHASLNAGSRGLIDARRLGLMRSSSYLINTARGPIVDEAALIEALARRRIAGAALDVFDTEPMPAGHPLASLPNVVMTPHIGWPTDSGYERFAESAFEVLFACIHGREFPKFAESSHS